MSFSNIQQSQQQSSAITNSLALLNEIKEQLHQSKQSINKKTPGKAQLLNDKRNQINKSNEQENPVYTNDNNNIPNSFLNKINETSNTPNATQSPGGKTATDNQELFGYRKESKFQHTSQITPQIGLNNNFNNDQLTKKYLNIDNPQINNKENENYNNATFTKLPQQDEQSFKLRSQELAEEIRKNIKKEMENFAQECDDVQSKLRNLLNKMNDELLEDKAIHQQKSSAKKNNKESALKKSIKQFNQQFDNVVQNLEEKKLRFFGGMDQVQPYRQYSQQQQQQQQQNVNKNQQFEQEIYKNEEEDPQEEDLDNYLGNNEEKEQNDSEVSDYSK